MFVAKESTWTQYATDQFKNLNMRNMTIVDPSGLVLLLALLLLCMGIVTATLMRLFFPNWTKQYMEDAKKSLTVAKQNMDQNINDIHKLRGNMEKNFEEVSENFKKEAMKRSRRQGFVVEMLSFSYLSRLAFSSGIFAFTAYLNALAAVVAGWRTPDVIILNLDGKDSGEKTLPDLGHDAFKYLMGILYGKTTYIDWFELPDQFLFVCGVVTTTMILFHPRRLQILRRVLAVFAFINFFRACCVAVTSLPDASPQCVAQFGTDRGAYKKKAIFPGAFIRAFKVLARPSKHITCGDMVFSGHTVFLVLCAMIVKTYCRRDQLSTPFTRRYPIMMNIIRYFIYTGVFTGMFAIIGTKLHYTLDVLIANFVTIQCWMIYHWFTGKKKLHESSILAWLEHDDVYEIDQAAAKFAKRSDSTCSDGLAEELNAEMKKTK